MEAMIAFAGGNPGAITVLLKLCSENSKIDPDCAWAEFGPLISLDSYDIYEERIWMLYKDVCGENVVNTLACLRAMQLGLVPESTIDSAIDGRTKLDVDIIVKQVKVQLPAFGNL